MTQLKIRPLSAERVTQAFPLIQTVLPEVTLAAWRDFAATLLAGGDAGGDTLGEAWEGGILAATDGRNYIAGSEYTVADIAAQCAFVMGKAAVGVRIPAELEYLNAWWQRVSTRPTARA